MKSILIGAICFAIPLYALAQTPTDTLNKDIILKEIVSMLDSMNMGLEVGIRVAPTET